MQRQGEALKLLESSLNDLESPKGSILSAVQKLFRAADLIEEEDIKIWCSIQLGEPKYTKPLKELLALYGEAEKSKKNTKRYEELHNEIKEKYKALKTIGMSRKHYNSEELNIKYDESGGGYESIGFIEERYADLVRLKKGNDGTYYKTNLNKHLNHIKKTAHIFSKELYNKLKFSGTVKSCFDLLKEGVDDKLFEIKESLAEQLMISFKSLSSESPEEWSQALTSCRRLIEGLADELYPPSEEKINGRALGKGQYINRLWAFMDKTIDSSSNKELAKTHVDYLGSWLQSSYKLTNKGVHAELTRLEATKAIFHTYLMVADIIEYLDVKPVVNGKININDATIDQLEALLEISRAIARKIVKQRIENGIITIDSIKEIPGVGPKTILKITEAFNI